MASYNPEHATTWLAEELSCKPIPKRRTPCSKITASRSHLASADAASVPTALLSDLAHSGELSPSGKKSRDKVIARNAVIKVACWSRRRPRLDLVQKNSKAQDIMLPTAAFREQTKVRVVWRCAQSDGRTRRCVCESFLARPSQLSAFVTMPLTVLLKGMPESKVVQS